MLGSGPVFNDRIAPGGMDRLSRMNLKVLKSSSLVFVSVSTSKFSFQFKYSPKLEFLFLQQAEPSSEADT